MAKEFNLEIDKTIDEIIDEIPGNSYIALRKLRWSEDAQFKLDIRKWYTNSQGEEIAGKGVSFMTDEGPGNLIKVLLAHGYGNTRETLDALSNREEFLPCVKKIMLEKNVDFDSIEVPSIDDVAAAFYDPRSSLM